jgi:hypothetical protein
VKATYVPGFSGIITENITSLISCISALLAINLEEREIKRGREEGTQGIVQEFTLQVFLE